MQTGRGGQTNDIGEYRIYGLSPGQYYVSATLRNFNMGNRRPPIARATPRRSIRAPATSPRHSG